MQHLSDYLNESIQIDEGLWSWLKKIFSKKKYYYRLLPEYEEQDRENNFLRVSNNYMNYLKTNQTDYLENTPGFFLVKLLKKNSDKREKVLNYIKSVADSEKSVLSFINNTEFANMLIDMCSKSQQKELEEKQFNERSKYIIGQYIATVVYSLMMEGYSECNYFKIKYFDKKKIEN